MRVGEVLKVRKGGMKTSRVEIFTHNHTYTYGIAYITSFRHDQLTIIIDRYDASESYHILYYYLVSCPFISYPYPCLSSYSLK